jgi:uncharacterized repeat protein (TIGR01451 family)
MNCCKTVSDMQRMIYLAILMLLIQSAHAVDSNDDEVTYNDFTLNAGERIDIGDYRSELIEIQSLKDGLVVMRISKVGGALDEQRALLQNSANNFDGGSENEGITITVTDIFDDQTAKVRVEYKKSLGTAKKRASDIPRSALDKPNLFVQKIFEKNQMSVGDEVKVTVIVKNIGNGQALNINTEDLPPLPEFSYIAGYPPKIKDTLDPGKSDSAIYVISAVKEGSIRVPAVQVSYTDSKKNVKSNNSEPVNVLINPKSKADLQLFLKPTGPIAVNGKGMLNISLSNIGKASATKVELKGEIKPSEGLEVKGLDKSFFEILPEEEENYSAELLGKQAGNYTVILEASFQSGDGAVIEESKAEVVVLEQEYKYLYLLLIIPIIVIVIRLYKRYRDYKY